MRAISTGFWVLRSCVSASARCLSKASRIPEPVGTLRACLVQSPSSSGLSSGWYSANSCSTRFDRQLAAAESSIRDRELAARLEAQYAHGSIAR